MRVSRKSSFPSGTFSVRERMRERKEIASRDDALIDKLRKDSEQFNLSSNCSMRRSMIFHCFPFSSADWRDVCWSTFRYSYVFNGVIKVAITTGDNCDDVSEVEEWFTKISDRIEFTHINNSESLGLNTSFRGQLRSIQQEEGIVFKSHTKGVTHLRSGYAYSTWLNSMTRGCLGNIPLVESKFTEGFKTFGVFKTTTEEGAAVVSHTEKRWKGWHYPGALFWFDPKSIPESFFSTKMHHYENEEFPCIIGPTETGYSLTPDNISFWKPLCLTWS